MKVLIACGELSNPYVDVIVEGLTKAGAEVSLDLELFWRGDVSGFDIVHIHWPDALFNWSEASEAEIERLAERLTLIERYSVIVHTLHNLSSNKRRILNEERMLALYTLVESHAHAVVHLGEASPEMVPDDSALFQLPFKVIPNPVCDKLYAPYLAMTKQEACKKLHLPFHSDYGLAFGKIRNQDEVDFLRKAGESFKQKKSWLLVPKLYRPVEYAFHFRHPMQFIRSSIKWFKNKRFRIIAGSKKLLSDEEVASYFAVSDMVLIPRLNDINSGNLPMAFLFGKVVVGPDSGNIGTWLRATGNPVFQPGNESSIEEALVRGQELALAGKGKENFDYAMKHWSTEKVGQAHYEFYEEMLFNSFSQVSKGKS